MTSCIGSLVHTSLNKTVLPNTNTDMLWTLVLPRDGNGADRDRIMSDLNPPRTGTINTQFCPAPVVEATYPAPLPNRPTPPQESGYRVLTRPDPTLMTWKPNLQIIIFHSN